MKNEYKYDEARREAVKKIVFDPLRAMQPMSESTGYALYDLLGLQLNELQRINDTLEFISNIIQQDKQRLLFIFGVWQQLLH